ncbi:hypothetical protein [Ramlibacter sp. AN1133]|uniref:hypothetical protein n=1 Tax=Ramlibacter sp. AN1133 TaxID=3133429 RepID=UPI0030BB9C22
MFFDDLGPPWPKHWCTDSSRFDEAAVAWSAPVPGASTPRWYEDGWRSLTRVYVDRVSDSVCKIRSANTELIFRCSDPPAISAARVRRRADGSYELSLLEYDERVGLWVTHEGIARLHYAGMKRGDLPLVRKPVVAPSHAEAPGPHEAVACAASGEDQVEPGSATPVNGQETDGALAPLAKKARFFVRLASRDKSGTAPAEMPPAIQVEVRKRITLVKRAPKEK